MSTFKNKNSLKTIEAQIVQELKNNEARPKFTGSYKKKACITNTNLNPKPKLTLKEETNKKKGNKNKIERRQRIAIF